MVETPREVCQEEAKVIYSEKCSQVARKVPKVECQTKMKEIELKEICLEIDIQLPREECTKEEKEECKYEVEEDIVQQCQPTVREECHTVMKTECQDKCKYCVVLISLSLS